MNVELLAISAGLELLDALGISGTVYSACQGLVKKLHHPHVLRRTPANPGFPLIRVCVRRLRHPSRQLQLIRSHPERSWTPRSAWDQSQWWIFLADPFLDYPSRLNALRRVPYARTIGTVLWQAMPPSSAASVER